MANVIWGVLSASGVRINDYLVTITETEYGHRLTVSRTGYEDQYIDIPDADVEGKQDKPASPGTAGQVLGLDDNLSPVWMDQSGGGSADIGLSVVDGLLCVTYEGEVSGE